MTKNNEIGLKEYFNEKFETLNRNFEKLELLMTNTLEVINNMQQERKLNNDRIGALELLLKPKNPNVGYISRFDEIEHQHESDIKRNNLTSIKWTVLLVLSFIALMFDQTREMFINILPKFLGI